MWHFTSHIVQIKRGQGEAAKAAKALYIPHSSDKTMMVLSKEVGISTLHPT